MIIEKMVPNMLLLLILCIAVITDIRLRKIPNQLILPGIIAAIIIRLFFHELAWIDYVIGFFAGSGLLFLVAVSTNAVGGGDIKLYAFIGLILGWQLTLIALLIASFLALAISSVLVLTRKLRMKDPIPFAPYAVLGVIFVMVNESYLIHLMV